MTHYTLVQHSAWVRRQDHVFEHAVEEVSIPDSLVEVVSKAGGVVLPDYKTAYDRSLAENYPPGVEGLHPKCSGTFSKRKVKGAALYIPKEPTP